MGLASKLAAAQANQAAQGVPPAGGFAPPSGPPPGAPYGGGYAPPSGPPPQTGHPAGGYAPPSGPPPPHLQARPQAGATAAAAAVDNTKVDMPTLMNILRHTVTEQKIGAFYKDKDLEGIAKRLLSTDVLRQIAARLRVPMSLGIDLAKVALFDVVLLCDDSMSMKAHQGGARIVELKKILSHITAACTLLDEDGIAIRFFNSNVEGNNIKSEGQISDLVDRAGNSSGTPIGTSLEEKVLKPLLLKPAKSMIKKLRKPLLVIVITDGAPYNEKGVKHNRDKLPQVIKHTMAELSRTKYGPDAVSYQFAQVGDDEQAREFLSNLDEDPVIGGFIDQTMGFEYEQDQMAKQGAELTPETWAMKLLLGPIDDSYDAQDEA